MRCLNTTAAPREQKHTITNILPPPSLSTSPPCRVSGRRMCGYSLIGQPYMGVSRVQISVSDEKRNLTCIVLSLLLASRAFLNPLQNRYTGLVHSTTIESAQAGLVHRNMITIYHCYHTIPLASSYQTFVISILLGSRRIQLDVLSGAL